MPATPRVTSTKNPIVRRFRAVAAGEDNSLLVADGIRLLHEALDAGLPLREVAVAAGLAETPRGRELVARVQAAAELVHVCADNVIGRISHLDTPQGAVGIVGRPHVRPRHLLGRDRALVVVAAGIKDPGNLGALVRAAEAAGASGLIALAGGADPFRDKAVRGSAGSIFRLPVLGGWTIEQTVAFSAEHALQLIVTAADAEADYWSADLRRPTAIVFGGEGEGVPAALRAKAAGAIRIALAPAVESLNVAVAAGIVLFEAKRQRA
jgi:TrmH family RNA methyltransferase